MGETRVDLLHLLEDLADAYPGPLEETILTEIIANSLDSGASQIRITMDYAGATLVVADNGRGMRRREMGRYHDLAASTKIRGQGIGFAGVGMKLGLLVCEEVFTETLQGRTHAASRWHLASRYRAPWHWVPPLNLVAERGTAVRLKLTNALSPLLDEGFAESAVRRHYQPLLDPGFDEILASHYPQGVRFELNGRPLERHRGQARDMERLEVRLARHRKPAALGYLMREEAALPEERRGVTISTFGKVIKRGWEWLGLTPSAPERIGGLIEAPALAACLTLNKGDFLRSGARGATYLSYRKIIQQAVSQQLAAWGNMPEPTDSGRRRTVRPWERDLERVLVHLADEFPMLASVVERRAGGQKRLPIDSGAKSDDEVPIASFPNRQTKDTEGTQEPPQAVPDDGEEKPNEPPNERPKPPTTVLAGTRGPRRAAHYGLSIGFEHRPADPELGRLVESTVLVNEAHPAYRRAIASHSEGYHIALTVALALAPLAVESKDEHTFLTAFLTRWGEAFSQRIERARR